MIKLTKAQGFDPYTILQGKRDKSLDAIIKAMDKQETIWITNGGTYFISSTPPITDAYTKYFNHYISAGDRKSPTKT
jgi:hypothetical protein